MELRNFNDLFKSIPKTSEINLLIGNGFSQAFDHKIFNYQNLYDKADFGDRDRVLRAVFDALGTYDFESVMLALDNTKNINAVYGGCEDLIQVIEQDGENLKKALVKVIADTHPEKPLDVGEPNYAIARPFLNQFRKIFSLNYDLLAYWIINKTEFEPPRGYGHFNDGFTGDQWEGHPEQNIFFLHGGMHLYEDRGIIKKHTFNRIASEGIVSKVQKNLSEGKFPVFVSEPSSDKKLERIKHQEYLWRCYNSLKDMRGYLFIHGHSIDDNDEHIFTQIDNSWLARICISIYGDPASDSNVKTMENAKRMLSRKKGKVVFYSADSAKIWYK